MVEVVDTAFVKIWGQVVGAVSWDAERRFATFEYDPGFLEKGLDLSPLTMPLAAARRGATKFAFRALSEETFKGLPGLLADSLPDRFGHRIIDAWLARQGRTAESFSPVERLCYTGRRGMGALEFAPALQVGLDASIPVELSELVELAQLVTDERARLKTDLGRGAPEALLDILRVGTSAGGGRPKAVIALNDTTQEVRSGQLDAPAGFDHWLLKFDGVEDAALGDPAGYGRIEFAYHRMAVAAGIIMPECRLFEENGRAHFMARRFDRPHGGGKLHLQSLCGLGHFDFQEPGATSYEQAFQVMRELRLPYPDAEQQFLRMVFNVVARNQDDHTKNIAFLMDRSGEWHLSPAFDVTYAYNPEGRWTSRHQMTIAGKREEFTREDLLEVAREMSIKRAKELVGRVVAVVSAWPEYAREAGVDPARVQAIARAHRLLT
ncbi:MAG: type II toxin-antitoxin system HipA family toxin [Planctomycetota bacterium]